MPSPPKSLAAKTSAVSAATLGSRVLGFARDVGTAAILGAGPLADALMAALSLPLLARRLLAEGAFNAALLPALVADEKRAAATANATLALLCMILLGLALVGALAMPVLMMVLVPGFYFEGDRAGLAVACGRIALFYLPLAGAAAVLGGIANSAHRVFLPALSPALGNVVVLCAIAALFLEGLGGTPTAAMVMASGAVLAGVAQLLLVAASAWGAPLGIHPGAGFDWRGARTVLRAARPALLFAGLPQMRILIVAAVVSTVPGSVSALNYAQRLIDLPLGLVGASAGAVLVPLLTSGGGAAGRGQETGKAVLAALGFALPAATGLLILCQPIISVLYERVNFTADDAFSTAMFLAVLALALPLQGLEKVLSAAAMSHGLARHVEGIVYVALSNTLVIGIGFGFGFGLGTAAAFSVFMSAAISVFGLCMLLSTQGLLVFGRAERWRMFGMMGGCLLMAVVVVAGLVLWPPQSGIMGAVRLAVLVVVGIATYGAVWLPLMRRRPRSADAN